MGYTNDDTFSVEQSGTQVTVSKIGSADGWDMDLKFYCCAKNGNYEMKLIKKICIYLNIFVSPANFVTIIAYGF